MPFSPLALLALFQTDLSGATNHCHMTNPTSDVVEFSLGLGPDGEHLIIPSEGSVWPRRNLVVSRSPQSPTERGSAAAYSIGTGPLARGLEIDERGRSTIYALDDGASVLPLAVGFCSERPRITSGNSNAVGSLDPFAISRWADDCGFIARDGRRGRIQFNFRTINQVEVVDLDSGIWSRNRYVLNYMDPTSRRPRFAYRPSGRGPRGTDTFEVWHASAARILEFSELGSDSQIGEQEARAICGYARTVTRATRL